MKEAVTELATTNRAYICITVGSRLVKKQNSEEAGGRVFPEDVVSPVDAVLPTGGSSQV